MELVITGDGSHTLKSPVFDECYHSIHGALQESNHVFINAGLLYVFEKFPSADLAVLEIGFGTGLNTLLTWIKAEQHRIRISYTALEPYPLEEKIWTGLNYTDLLDHEDHRAKFRRLHTTGWNKTESLSDYFTVNKISTELQNFLPPCGEYQLVYFDAFSPAIQPELWTPAVFTKLAEGMKAGGVLATYTVKGSVVRAMKQAGFSIEKLPGPPGKRHILRGVNLWHDLCKTTAP